MRELVKYFLGIVIIVTIIYTVYISYNVFKFVSSEESTANIADYELKISLIDEEIIELENKFNEQQLRDNSNSIVMNYDGTPVAWVVMLKLEQNLNFEELENSLLESGFISFQKDNAYTLGLILISFNLKKQKNIFWITSQLKQMRYNSGRFKL